MKILQVHNYYQQKGGEDVVVGNEKKLLVSNGNKVVQYLRTNKEIDEYNLLEKSKFIFQISYSKNTFNEISSIIKKEKPDICHVHNILPLISPSVYFACQDNDVPVIQTLHNYRLLCSNAYLFKEGKICEECIGGSLFHSVKYGCYRNSKMQTLALAQIIEKHKKLKTWNEKINGYIAPTFFTKNKYLEGGFSEDKIFVKPNFISQDPGYGSIAEDYFIFVGRLDELKGFNTLERAGEYFLSEIKIKLAGKIYREDLSQNNSFNFLGLVPHKKLLEIIKKSAALIFPSNVYETFGNAIIEAFACGKPVIASNHGAMAELIEDGKTGLLFEPGNSEELAEKINWAFTHKEEMMEMGINAREEFEEQYTAEKNYEKLMEIYNNVLSKYIRG